MDRRRFLKALSLLSLLPLLESGKHAGATRMRSHGSQDGPNVLILLFDTLSARHMSLYGYRRRTTANLARFAERATVYHAHYAAGNYTPPSTASLLTGTYPWTHRAFHPGGIVPREQAPRNLLELCGPDLNRILYPQNFWVDLLLHQFRQDGDIYLAPQEFCLADHTFPTGLFPNDADIAHRSLKDLLFRGRGYPGGSLYLSLAHRLNMLSYEKSGLGEYADLYPAGVPRQEQYNVYFLLEHVIDGIMALLSTARQPFLAYLHLFPPHEPYRPRREFLGMFDDNYTSLTKEPHPLSPGHPQEALNRWRTEYDEYIAYVDAEFGRLHSFLSEAGMLDNSYVMVTSDHGQLFERGVHGHVTELLYDPVIHIPLLISRPGQRQGEDVHVPTSTVDLLPTVLHVLGKSVPDWCEGEILPPLGGEPGGDERSVLSVEAKRNPAHRPLSVGTIALIRGRHKLIHYFGYEGYEDEYELYDLTNDPEERENLYSQKRSLAADLQHELSEKLAEANRPYLP
jgi:arylsulfatase A-like enzyme